MYKSLGLPVLHKQWNNVQQNDKMINKCNITNSKDRSKNRADWEKSIKVVKVCIGL